ncbi:MAG: hypothetical protein KIT84_42680 [Labilithrix sp.]|nr:hypothetical protein [Labilithrix sp.]MCW5817784.1 hypothetical protein [Labilithrix sp.]
MKLAWSLLVGLVVACNSRGESAAPAASATSPPPGEQGGACTEPPGCAPGFVCVIAPCVVAPCTSGTCQALE